MAIKTLTSSNSVLMLAIEGVYDQMQLLEGYDANNIFGTDAVTPAEVVMGLDGVLSAGYVPYATVMNITLLASSDSGDIFDRWADFQKSAREVFYATGYCSIPSIGKKYSARKGVLTSYMPLPDGQRILQPRRFSITWEEVSPGPI